jgi:hypothetical protein
MASDSLSAAPHFPFTDGRPERRLYQLADYELAKRITFRKGLKNARSGGRLTPADAAQYQTKWLELFHRDAQFQDACADSFDPLLHPIPTDLSRTEIPKVMKRITRAFKAGQRFGINHDYTVLPRGRFSPENHRVQFAWRIDELLELAEAQLRAMPAGAQRKHFTKALIGAVPPNFQTALRAVFATAGDRAAIFALAKYTNFELGNA